MQPKQPLRQAIAKEFLLPGKLIISLLRNKSESSKSTVDRSKRKTLAKIFENLNRIKNKKTDGMSESELAKLWAK